MQNNATFPNDLQLSGGFIPLHNLSLIDGPVEPGMTVTYQWLVSGDNGPAADDLSTIAFTYGSSADPVADLYAGLYGIVVIARPVSPINIPASHFFREVSSQACRSSGSSLMHWILMDALTCKKTG